MVEELVQWTLHHSSILSSFLPSFLLSILHARKNMRKICKISFSNLIGHSVNDREVVRAGVFAFVLPHFFTKVDVWGAHTLSRLLAIQYKRFLFFWGFGKQPMNIFRDGSRWTGAHTRADRLCTQNANWPVLVGWKSVFARYCILKVLRGLALSRKEQGKRVAWLI